MFEAEQQMRLPNGARKRMDGKGDGWAQAHRDELGAGFNMQDIDGYVGMMGFAGNTGERLFWEYVPDDYKNRGQHIRTFGVVALFDRKTTRDAAFADRNMVSRQFYLYQCRAFAQVQPVVPKFFYVIGGHSGPWTMLELDVKTGEQIKVWALETMAWKSIWHATGLSTLREELRRWLSIKAEAA